MYTHLFHLHIRIILLTFPLQPNECREFIGVGATPHIFNPIANHRIVLTVSAITSSERVIIPFTPIHSLVCENDTVTVINGDTVIPITEDSNICLDFTYLPLGMSCRDNIINTAILYDESVPPNVIDQSSTTINITCPQYTLDASAELQCENSSYVLSGSFSFSTTCLSY